MVDLGRHSVKGRITMISEGHTEPAETNMAQTAIAVLEKMGYNVLGTVSSRMSSCKGYAQFGSDPNAAPVIPEGWKNESSE